MADKDVVGYGPGGLPLHEGSGFDNWWDQNVSGLDILAPGSTWLMNKLDLTGERAASIANSAQWAMQKDAQKFSADEAEKARIFEAQQSANAYQRAVADMKAAGLNPYWISSMNSASTASGHAASSSAGSSSMANNKIVMAAGLIATALRLFLTKGK